ncbi:uncharacterized protein LOC107882505 [Acyrthosiphon pisum]|uniref:MADF domain-containing protein n=1 Tax=Acyrthosiphon pisum TaxID=7029 RepID=A0A8R2JX41_ACYPI|nr:uncharacterized protein LOC107882505 [Acyrthosiphon pisum]
MCKMFVIAKNEKHVCHNSGTPKEMSKCHPIKPRTVATTSSFKELMQECGVNDEADKEPEEETELLDFSTQLIIEVEKRRPLWDARLPKADRYPQIINRLWMEIINVLNCGSLFTTKQLEKKFGYLKEQYRREKSKLIKPSGAQGGKQLKQWMHFKSLTFLDEVYVQNK